MPRCKAFHKQMRHVSSSSISIMRRKFGAKCNTNNERVHNRSRSSRLHSFVAALRPSLLFALQVSLALLCACVHLRGAPLHADRPCSDCTLRSSLTHERHAAHNNTTQSHHSESAQPGTNKLPVGQPTSTPTRLQSRGANAQSNNQHELGTS